MSKPNQNYVTLPPIGGSYSMNDGHGNNKLRNNNNNSALNSNSFGSFNAHRKNKQPFGKDRDYYSYSYFNNYNKRFRKRFNQDNESIKASKVVLLLFYLQYNKISNRKLIYFFINHLRTFLYISAQTRGGLMIHWKKKMNI